MVVPEHINCRCEMPEILTPEEVKTKLKQIEHWEKELAAMKEQIDAEWVELRRKCPHSQTTYLPDPSGNNDSEYRCDICGAYSKRGWPDASRRKA